MSTVDERTIAADVFKEESPRILAGLIRLAGSFDWAEEAMQDAFAAAAEQLDLARAGEQMTIVGAHTVGGPDGGPGLPGTGWSTDHGDLRVVHFLGLHALQALPIVAFVLARRRLSDLVRLRLTITAAASYVGLFGILLSQALRGQPVLAPDALTIALLAVWAFGTAAAAAASAVLPQPARTPAVV